MTTIQAIRAAKQPPAHEGMRKIDRPPLSFLVRGTPFGPLAVLWAEHRHRPSIFLILLSAPGLPAERRVRISFPEARRSSCPEIDLLADRMAAFLGGEDIPFSLDIARMDLCSEFQEGVLRAEHGIPRGRVSTYRRIACHLGKPGAARAVGTALATNPFPILIPCHRAVRSDGTPGGYQGGPAMKQTLLRMEGILFDAAGRVVAEEFFY